MLTENMSGYELNAKATEKLLDIYDLKINFCSCLCKCYHALTVCHPVFQCCLSRPPREFRGPEQIKNVSPPVIA